MSVKGKNLSYEAQEPIFLRKLRAQQGGLDADRHERPVARPRRVTVDHEDDDPTYIDEASNQTLSREEYEAMLSGKPVSEPHSTGVDDKAEPQNGRDLTHLEQPNAEKNARKVQEVTEAGKSLKKRKVAKAVGIQDTEAETNSKPVAAKKQKKAKAVKLSFGNEQDEDA